MYQDMSGERHKATRSSDKGEFRERNGHHNGAWWLDECVSTGERPLSTYADTAVASFTSSQWL